MPPARRGLLSGLVSGLGTALAGCALRSPVEESGTPSLHGTDPAYQGGYAPGGEWPMDNADASRSGRNRHTKTPRGDVDAAWLRTAAEDGRSFFTTAPITDEKWVYVGSATNADSDDRRRTGFLTALDGERGRRVWRSPVANGHVRGTAVENEVLLAVATGEDENSDSLVALATGDGSERWRYELSNPIGGPAIVSGTAYVVTHSSVLAISLDGTRQWRWTIPDSSGDERLSSQPCVGDRSVFVGTDRGDVVALDGSSGNLAWKESVVTSGHRPRVQSTPTFSDGVLYVSGTDYRLYAVAGADGSPEWSRRLLEKSYGNGIPSAAVYRHAVYVNTIHGGLLALDRADGTERWRTGKYGGSIPPAVADGLVVTSTGDSVVTYDTSGTHRWTFEMEPFDAGMAAYVMDAEIALAHNRVYVTLHDGRVFSLGAKTDGSGENAIQS